MIDFKSKKFNIVIDLHHGIGDLFMFLPTLNVILTQVNDETKIFILVKSKLESDFLGVIFPRLNGYQLIFSKENIFDMIKQIRKIRPYLFFFPMASDSFKTYLFAKICNSKYTCGPLIKGSFFRYTIIQKKTQIHRTKYYFNFLDLLKLNTSNVKFEISKIAIQENVLNKLLTNSSSNKKLNNIIFSPGSGEIESHKRWPATKYIELAKIIFSNLTDYKITIFGSLGETKLLQNIYNNLNQYSDRVEIIYPKNLIETLHIFNNARVLICADAGSVHIASLINLPTIGLYGPGNPGEFGPLTDKKRVVRLGLECSPCYRRNFIHGCGNPICMTNIDSKFVYQELLLLLNKKYDHTNLWIDYTNATKYSTKITKK